jgi:hypothetical protein
VVERDESEAIGIVLGSITQRRHFSKGALAYLCCPVIEAAAPSHGGDRKSRPLQAVLISTDDLCAKLGFSKDMYDRARLTHKFFADHTKYLWSRDVTGTGHPERMTCREMWEDRLLSGVAGLDAINRACGFITRSLGPEGKEVESENLANRRNHLQYIEKAWEKTIFHHVRCLSDEVERRQAAGIIANNVMSLPEDIFEEVAAEIRRAARQRKGGM